MCPTAAETLIAAATEHGDVDSMVSRLQRELRALAGSHLRREGPRASLQPTELVNEAYLRLVRQYSVRADRQTLFLGAAAMTMRRVLIDRARARDTRKRGADYERVELDSALTSPSDDSIDLLALDELLGELERELPTEAHVVQFRLFAGMTHAEISEALAALGKSHSEHSVGRMWRRASLWLQARLAEPC